MTVDNLIYFLKNEEIIPRRGPVQQACYDLKELGNNAAHEPTDVSNSDKAKIFEAVQNLVKFVLEQVKNESLGKCQRFDVEDS